MVHMNELTYKYLLTVRRHLYGVDISQCMMLSSTSKLYRRNIHVCVKIKYVFYHLLHTKKQPTWDVHLLYMTK